jgi:hypothetical protein
MNMPDEKGIDLHATALHEAGHAVVGYRLGIQSDELSVVPDFEEGSWGHHNTDIYEDWVGHESPSGARDCAIQIYAGAEAQRFSDPSSDISTSWSDNERATIILQFTNGETEVSLREEASRMVRKNWTQISAVAEELVSAKKLSWHEWSIIIDAIDEGEDWHPILERLRINRRMIYGK